MIVVVSRFQLIHLLVTMVLGEDTTWTLRDNMEFLFMLIMTRLLKDGRDDIIRLRLPDYWDKFPNSVRKSIGIV